MSGIGRFEACLNLPIILLH